VRWVPIPWPTDKPCRPWQSALNAGFRSFGFPYVGGYGKKCHKETVALWSSLPTHLPAVPDPTMKKKKKSQSGKTPNRTAHALLAKARMAETLLEAAREHLHLAKVEHRQARKSLKQAKKAARRARKAARKAGISLKQPKKKVIARVSARPSPKPKKKPAKARARKRSASRAPAAPALALPAASAPPPAPSSTSPPLSPEPGSD